MEPLPGLGCHEDGQQVEVGLIRCLAVKTGVRTSAVVKVQIPADRLSRFADAVVSPQIELLVFDAAPQPFDEHVVTPGAFAVHADRDAVLGQHAGEGMAGELRTLVGVEDPRLAMTRQSIPERVNDFETVQFCI